MHYYLTLYGKQICFSILRESGIILLFTKNYRKHLLDVNLAQLKLHLGRNKKHSDFLVHEEPTVDVIQLGTLHFIIVIFGGTNSFTMSVFALNQVVWLDLLILFRFQLHHYSFLLNISSYNLYVFKASRKQGLQKSFAIAEKKDKAYHSLFSFHQKSVMSKKFLKKYFFSKILEVDVHKVPQISLFCLNNSHMITCIIFEDVIAERMIEHTLQVSSFQITIIITTVLFSTKHTSSIGSHPVKLH
jgi:hypothetical protein